jgi:hypothetical protein
VIRRLLGAVLLVASTVACGTTPAQPPAATPSVHATTRPATSRPAVAKPTPTKTTKTRTTPPVEPEPAETVRVIRAGSFCSPQGAHGRTSTGKAMVCKPSSTDDRNRWRAA